MISRRSSIRYALACILFTSGCSATGLARGAADLLFVRDHLITVRDVPYGRHDLRLDVHRPRLPRANAPVVVFLFGGRWKYGSKDDYRVLGDALTKQGWVAVIPEYRLHPAVDYPAWVDDAADAVRWARDNIARFGGDSTNIVVIGHSAGAHTATLLALDERHLASVGIDPRSIRGFVSLAGPVDTIWTDADVQRLMGPSEGWPETYPRTHVDGTEPPLLLLHGRNDKTVHPENSVHLAARISAAGGCARSVLIDGVGHVKIILALAAPRLELGDVMPEVVRFVENPAGAACPAGSR
ncbi:MAG: alpha/beta hydrolase [Gemmatimonadaceae bacterium]|nr:alpha/beta hydrolase [Gemmatimonadaceae bacterium]